MKMVMMTTTTTSPHETAVVHRCSRRVVTWSVERLSILRCASDAAGVAANKTSAKENGETLLVYDESKWQPSTQQQQQQLAWNVITASHSMRPCSPVCLPSCCVSSLYQLYNRCHARQNTPKLGSGFWTPRILKISTTAWNTMRTTEWYQLHGILAWNYRDFRTTPPGSYSGLV